MRLLVLGVALQCAYASFKQPCSADLKAVVNENNGCVSSLQTVAAIESSQSFTRVTAEQNIRHTCCRLRGGSTASAAARPPQTTSWLAQRQAAVRTLQRDISRGVATLRTVGNTFDDVPNRKRLTAALLLLTLAVSATGIVFNFLSKDFWDALSEKDVAKFRQLVFKFLIALLVGTPLIGLHEYVKVSHLVNISFAIIVGLLLCAAS
jgi:hypothetical protein